MFNLGLSVAAFVITHIGLSSTPLREIIARKIGENGFIIIYSALALITLIGMIIAYSQAPHHIFLWLPGPGVRHLPLIVMPFVFIFLVAGVTAKNPTSLKMERSIEDENVVQGIVRITRHPVQWAIIAWALVHILANGDLASLIFFGGFLILSVSGTFLIDKKLGKSLGNKWQEFAQKTSNVPFAAILFGRNHLALAEIGWLKVIIGLVLYGVLLHAHVYLFGVRPY